MNTIANIKRSEASHWYFRDGRPCYEVERADKKGFRDATLADARKLDLVPSVTTVLKVLNKPGLNRWIQEQAILACLTAPRKEAEALDEFIDRVLNEEKQQEQESQKARDLGSGIHKAIGDTLSKRATDPEMEKYVTPAIIAASQFGRMVALEKVVVGDGYAGITDLITEGHQLTLIDFKSTRKIPKESYIEHRLQLAGYAGTIGNTADLPVQTVNIYISTAGPVEVVAHINPDWREDYLNGFHHVLHLWQFINGYRSSTKAHAA